MDMCDEVSVLVSEPLCPYKLAKCSQHQYVNLPLYVFELSQVCSKTVHICDGQLDEFQENSNLN